MKNSKLNIVNTLLLVGILIWLVVSNSLNHQVEKQAYVVTGELFSEFEYQKELDAEFKSIKSEKENNLSLLKTDLIQLENKIRSNNATEEDIYNYQIKFEKFRSIEFQTNQELAQINGDYTTKVWDKLNAFVINYGKENGYDVIFGASGEGNIMYATEKLNITQEVIEYCNLKYSGK